MHDSLVIDIANEAAMHDLGRLLADAVTPGLVIGLNGDLGTGKTRLIQGIAAGLGIPVEEVSSPTFVLIQEYLTGRLPLYHFDTYRVRDEDEFLELGVDEYFSGSGVCCVEWAERMSEVLPRDRLTIRISTTGSDSRRLELSAGGPQSLQVLQHVKSV